MEQDASVTSLSVSVSAPLGATGSALREPTALVIATKPLLICSRTIHCYIEYFIHTHLLSSAVSFAVPFAI